MQANQTSSTATPDTIRQLLLETVEAVLRKMALGQDVLVELLDIGQPLDSLPLATDEYGLASNRLRNAQRYLLSKERGAARYELQLLVASLRNG
jgi:hypothetical protein